MKRAILILLLALTLPTGAQELRGTWIARDAFTSKELLARAIDSLASANFNTVYINVWSRGYPLWKSNVFLKETGYMTDPEFSDRDILQEAIAEAHKHGLYVEAWMEYGFVGGWSGNQPPGKKGPIFEKHPDWVARQKNGNEIDKSNFYWMIQTRPDVQNFLISLAAEISRKYDIDGIELDRVRYSSIDYGYDSFTDSLYRLEHNGTPPPANTSDSGWIEWRAEKLNQFMSAFHDSIKSINSHISISNAPSLFSASYTSYNQYCQDWFTWANNDLADNFQVQLYVTSAQSFGNILDYITNNVRQKEKIFPSFAVSPNGAVLNEQVIEQIYQTSVQKGFKGNSIWYYGDLRSRNLFSWIKDHLYKAKAEPPFVETGWRSFHWVIDIKDLDNVIKNGMWKENPGNGYSGHYLTASEGSASVKYYCDLPADGYYEVYAFQNVAENNSKNVCFVINSKEGKADTVYVDQSRMGNSRWYKLGDYFLNKGRSNVAELSVSGLAAGESVNADAILIILNRGLSHNTAALINEWENIYRNKLNYKFDLNSFPNPFNSQTKISFNLDSYKPYELEIFNILGKKVFSIKENAGKPGKNLLSLNLEFLSSGLYLCNLRQGREYQAIKLVLSK
ncbi:MAG: family 10 glycosylhydrolase [Bacillota bacterium]